MLSGLIWQSQFIHLSLSTFMQLRNSYFSPFFDISISGAGIFSLLVV
jgi:hypothetical protein